MENFKKNFKKYFALLAGFYLGIRILKGILLVIFPDLWTFDTSDNSTITYSDESLIVFITFLTNIIFMILINNDLKKVNIKLISVLIVTFFSNVIGVLFCLILLFSADLNKKQN